MIDDLLLIQREFGDTATAQRVPQALVDTYTAANGLFAERRFCDALPVLDYFVTLDVDVAARVVDTAHADRVQSMLECGLEQFRTGAHDAAITRLDALVAAYPDRAQARSAIIAARVAVEVVRRSRCLPRSATTRRATST